MGKKIITLYSNKISWSGSMLSSDDTGRQNGIQSFEHPKHILKLMGKKIFTILRSKNVLSKAVFLSICIRMLWVLKSTISMRVMRTYKICFGWKMTARFANIVDQAQSDYSLIKVKFKTYSIFWGFFPLDAGVVKFIFRVNWYWYCYLLNIFSSSTNCLQQTAYI